MVKRLYLTADILLASSSRFYETAMFAGPYLRAHEPRPHLHELQDPF
jgi:hypothetical protein